MPERQVVRYYEPGVRTVLSIGEHVAAPDLPAGIGWCEAIVTPYNGKVGRHCWTYGRFERDGRRVCGLHVNAKNVDFGPAPIDAADDRNSRALGPFPVDSTTGDPKRAANETCQRN